MLTEIRLRNFKAFGDQVQSVALSRINVFIGENGTGKSSVLQVLLLLAQSAGQSQLLSRRFQFSDYRDLVHEGRQSENLALGFAGRSEQGNQAIEFTYLATFMRGGLLAEHDGRIRVRDWPALQQESTLEGVYKYGDKTTSQLRGTGYKVTLEATNQICGPISVLTANVDQSPEAKENYRVLADQLHAVLQCFSNAAKNAFVVKALRGFDDLTYGLSNEPSDQPADGQAVVSTFAYRREVEERVATWLEQVTDVRVSVHLVPNRQATLTSAAGYNIYHEGFGTNQLVWPLLQLAIAPEDSLIGIEEAEICLHPRAQIKLCDVLADVAKNEQKQLVLTTHSDHLLTGFLNMVAEGRLDPTDLSVYFFEKKGVVASATQLKVDEQGRLEGGLRGFVDVELDKLARRARALGAKPRAG